MDESQPFFERDHEFFVKRKQETLILYNCLRTMEVKRDQNALPIVAINSLIFAMVIEGGA